MDLPANERAHFKRAIESRAEEWSGPEGHTLWPMVLRIEQDPRVQAESY